MTKIGNMSFGWFFLNCLFFGAFASAEVSVQSIISENQIPLGETVTVTVNIQTDGNRNVNGEPKVPSLEGFDLLNTWKSSSTSSRLEQTNSGMSFKTTRRLEYNYLLTPQRKGLLKIDGFEVNVGGKIYRTKAITVEVIGGGRVAGKGQNPSGGSAGEDRFSQLLKERAKQGAGYRSMPRNLKEAFFVQVEVDKTEVFAGEQVLARWYLYSRGQVEHIDRLKFPTLRGFWKEDIEAAPSLNFRQEVINGVVYKKALLASHALFPISPGQAIIDEYKVKAVVRLSNGNFGLFAFGKPYSYTKTSERLKIKVKPIPEEGQPADFSGAVGSFDVGAVIEGRRFPVNQPFTLKIRFEGRGNAKLIDLPPVELSDQLELYDTKQEAKFFRNGSSFKDFELLIIPRQEGRVIVPGISTSVFNPDTQQFETKKTDPIVVQIDPAKSESQISGQKFDEEKKVIEEKVVKKQLPGLKISRSEREEMSATTQAGMWGGILFLILSSLVWKSRSELGWGKTKYDLRKVVSERFVSVRKKATPKDWRSSGTEMANVTYAVLGEMAGLGGASEEVSRIIAKLPPSVRREVGESLAKHVEQIQILSFAPEQVVGDLKEKTQLDKLVKSVEADLVRAIKLYEKEDVKSVG